MNIKPYKNSFILIAIALTLPVLAILVLQFYRWMEERQVIEREAISMAHQIALSADMQVESNIKTIRVMALSNAIMDSDWASAGSRIKIIADLNPQWNNVFIFDMRNGRKIVSLHDTENEKIDVAQLPFLSDAVPFVSGIIKEGMNCPCINIYSAIPSSSPPKYAIGVALSPVSLQEIVIEQAPKDYVAGILDSSGYIIARNLNGEKLIGEPASTSAREAITQKDAGLYQGVTLEGQKNYIGFEKSTLTGWSSHVAIPYGLIERPRFFSSLMAGLACAFGLIFAGGMIFYVMREFESGSSAHLGAIIASSDDIIISKGLDGVITSWNGAAEKILGWSADEAVGKHISLIIPEERLSEENQIISSIKAGRSVSHFETKRRKKDGGLIDLSITVSPIKDSQGRIAGASKIARDITERKAAEMMLAEERTTLEMLNRLAPKLAATLDLKKLVQTVTDETTDLIGADFGAFFYNVINDEGKALLLYTLSGAPREAFEHLGMPRATSLFGPSFRGEGTIVIDDVLTDPRYGKNSPHNGMPEGHLPVRSYLAVPVISRSGEVIGVLLFGHKETGMFGERDARLAEGIAALAAVGIDNARLYDEVTAGQKRAEEANRAKTDFLATMSHEIRTPMNAIVGISHILVTTASEKQVEYAKTLQAAANSMMTLINDLLDISKIESRNIELEYVAFSLSDLLAEMYNLFSIKAHDKSIEFRVDCGDSAQYKFSGDVTRLRQIISNLCGNALKFTERGNVSLKASVAPAENDSALVTITVQDTGIGIADDKKGVIFEKFTQADTSINRKYGGTGLGLSITKQLVEAMDGHIDVDSAVGIGSSFIVTLPIKLAEVVLQKKEEKQKPLQSNDAIKVLLVEDYEPNIVVASAFLDMFGYAHDVARNGYDALDKVKLSSYDAVLMDLQMPGMNGFETTQAIRRMDIPAASVAIIGMTAHAMAGDRESCLKAGMNDYISKPFNPEDLRSKIISAAAGQYKKSA
jgi:PAS domain S-box-containing protein